MQINVNPDYPGLAQHAWPQVTNAADRYGGPMGLAGKIVGLGVDEVKTGIPGWGWAGVGFVLGAVVAYALHDKIERLVR
jgi:hypothetical protein